jgi:hypothetical protein
VSRGHTHIRTHLLALAARWTTTTTALVVVVVIVAVDYTN